MSTYSLPSPDPCPQCGQPSLVCEFDDGLPSASGDACFVFTHACDCGYRQTVSHLVGHDQESRWDWLCDFCQRDWLSASAEIDATRRGLPILEVSPPDSQSPAPQPPVEQLYQSPPPQPGLHAEILDVNRELKRWLATHPAMLYELDSRKFELLVADILKDFGFEVELTPATRDGGKDIYAYIRSEICSLLMFVECKRYAPDHPVGIDIVQRLYDVQTSHHANKSMLVTTSFFTRPAIKEARRYESLMDLRDYEDLKKWLARYAGS